ncbi:hypothetical protein D3C86_1342690 [compost metagenome]
MRQRLGPIEPQLAPHAVLFGMAQGQVVAHLPDPAVRVAEGDAAQGGREALQDRDAAREAHRREQRDEEQGEAQADAQWPSRSLST